MKKLRWLPFIFLGINVLGGLAYMAATGAGGAFVAFNALLAGVAGLMFWTQSRGARRALERGEAVLRAVAAKAFDAPAEIVDKFESSLPGTSSALGPGGMLSPAKGFTATGTVGGVATKIATCTSTIARQRFELFHSYSYVTVDAENAAGRFRFLGRDEYVYWSRFLTDVPDHPLGHAAFDADWVTAGDPDIARGVLDDELRAQLIELQKRAHRVSKLGMSIELTASGLVVRWPGELDPELAITLRDLALRLRGRLLEYLRREGLIEARAADEGVRVEVDEVRAEVQEELQEVLAEGPASDVPTRSSRT